MHFGVASREELPPACQSDCFYVCSEQVVKNDLGKSTQKHMIPGYYSGVILGSAFNLISSSALSATMPKRCDSRHLLRWQADTQSPVSPAHVYCVTEQILQVLQ